MQAIRWWNLHTKFQVSMKNLWLTQLVQADRETGGRTDAENWGTMIFTSAIAFPVLASERFNKWQRSSYLLDVPCPLIVDLSIKCNVFQQKPQAINYDFVDASNFNIFYFIVLLKYWWPQLWNQMFYSEPSSQITNDKMLQLIATAHRDKV